MAKIGFLLLCGGKSSRMGLPKALIEVNGQTLLDAIAGAGADFEEKILSANDPVIPTPEGFVRCGDVYPGCGPMAGIHAALCMTDCDALVTAPCDAPHYSAALAQYLRENYDSLWDAQVLVDGDGKAQPLCGIYSKSSLPVLEEHLRTGKLKMMRMLEEMRLQRLHLPAGMTECVFENLNTPQELKSFQERRA